MKRNFDFVYLNAWDDYLDKLVLLLEDMRNSYEKVKDNTEVEKLWIRIAERLLRYSQTAIHGCSECAIEQAKKELNCDDLFNLSWQKWQKLANKKIITQEHVNPLTKMARDILTTKMSSKEIKSLLKEKVVVWITKEENERLNKKYKNNRPNGWRKCYKELGINIIPKT